MLKHHVYARINLDGWLRRGLGLAAWGQNVTDRCWMMGLTQTVSKPLLAESLHHYREHSPRLSIPAVFPQLECGLVRLPGVVASCNSSIQQVISNALNVQKRIIIHHWIWKQKSKTVLTTGVQNKISSIKFICTFRWWSFCFRNCHSYQLYFNSWWSGMVVVRWSRPMKLTCVGPG